MARPADPTRRAKTLAAATDYVLEHGLAGLSLRPLADALDTSTRMLLYDFASKEDLIIEVLAQVRRRESDMLAEHLERTGPNGPDLVRSGWDWISAKQRAPFLRLFFEVYIEAITRPDAYSEGHRAMVTEWLDQFGAGFGPSGAREADTTTATLVIAVVRGLLLDRLNTGDDQRTDQALEQFAQLLERPDP